MKKNYYTKNLFGYDTYTKHFLFVIPNRIFQIKTLGLFTTKESVYYVTQFLHNHAIWDKFRPQDIDKITSYKYYI